MKSRQDVYYSHAGTSDQSAHALTDCARLQHLLAVAAESKYHQVKNPVPGLGCRLMSLAAIEAARVACLTEPHFDYNEVSYATLARAESARSALPRMPRDILASDLVLAWTFGDMLRVSIFGTGFFVHKTKTALRVLRVSFPAAPKYPWTAAAWEETESSKGQKIVSDSLLDRQPGDQDWEETGTDKALTPYAPVSATVCLGPGDIVVLSTPAITQATKFNSAPTRNWKSTVETLISISPDAPKPDCITSADFATATLYV